MCGDCVCRPPSGRSIPGGLDHGSRISFSRLLLRAHARGGFSVHVSSLSPVCRNCRNCRTILSDCRTLSDTVGRWKTVEDSKHPVTTENCCRNDCRTLSDAVGLSDCRTVGLSEDCRILSDPAVGLSDRGSARHRHTASWPRRIASTQAST